MDDLFQCLGKSLFLALWITSALWMCAYRKIDLISAGFVSYFIVFFLFYGNTALIAFLIRPVPLVVLWVGAITVSSISLRALWRMIRDPTRAKVAGSPDRDVAQVALSNGSKERV